MKDFEIQYEIVNEGEKSPNCVKIKAIELEVRGQKLRCPIVNHMWKNNLSRAALDGTQY